MALHDSEGIESMAENNEKTPRLIIGADFVPTDSNFELFKAGSCERLLGPELLSLVKSANFAVFNLEVPLTDVERPIAKCGPCLSAPTSTVNGLKTVNPWAFALANNHIMDQGEAGLLSTLNTLDAAGLSYFGAGMDLASAKKPLIKNVSGVKVGIYNCVEHEFSVAGKFTAGAAPYDPLESFDDVRELSGRCDYLIVLYHGGKEHYRYPSPQLQRRCRKFAECGARLVVCQHSHCVGCMEEWADATIVYGQGNFLFDDVDDGDNEFWKTGLLIEIGLGCSPVVAYHPIVKSGSTVRLASEVDAVAILDGFYERSREIGDERFVERAYSEFAETALGSYLACGIPGSRSLLYRVINKMCRGCFSERITSTKSLLALLNHIECESHSELFSEGLKLAISRNFER